MTTFERDLSERLEAAATLAPEFQGVRVPAPHRRPAGSGGPRGWRRLVVAAAAIVVVAAGVTVGVNLASGSSGGEGAATCAARVEFQGRTYLGSFGWKRLPQRGESLGTAHTLSCVDHPGGTPDPSRKLVAYAIPGVPADQVLLANHTLWVTRDTTSTVLTSQRLTEPVACQATGAFHATGTLRSVFDSQGRQAADLVGTESVTARFDITDGPDWLIDDYQEVVVDATVTDATTGSEDQSVLRAALDDATPVTVELRCHGSDFFVTAVSFTN